MISLRDMFTVSSLKIQIASLESTVASFKREVKTLKREIRAWAAYADSLESKINVLAKRNADLRTINSDLSRQYSEVCDLLAKFQAAEFKQRDMFDSENFGTTLPAKRTVKTYGGDKVEVEFLPENPIVVPSNGHKVAIASDTPAIVPVIVSSDIETMLAALVKATNDKPLSDSERAKAIAKIESWNTAKAKHDYVKGLANLRNKGNLS